MSRAWEGGGARQRTDVAIWLELWGMSLSRNDVVGRRILSALQSRWTRSKGVELPGVAGKIWYYCDCFLELESTGLIEVDRESLVKSLASRRKLIPPDYPDMKWEQCYGMPILEVVTDPESNVFLLLGQGLYIRNCGDYPGGNRFFLSSMNGWKEDFRTEKFLTYWEKMPIDVVDV